MVVVEVGISWLGRTVSKVAISGVVFRLHPKVLWAEELEAGRTNMYKVRTQREDFLTICAKILDYSSIVPCTIPIPEMDL
jgi:hypothetical protein